MTEFQSHEPEFDYLKSLEIEEKINTVRRYIACGADVLFACMRAFVCDGREGDFIGMWPSLAAGSRDHMRVRGCDAYYVRVHARLLRVCAALKPLSPSIPRCCCLCSEPYDLYVPQQHPQGASGPDACMQWVREPMWQVRWCRSSHNTRMLLSTNDKTIKLWRVYEKQVTNLTNFNLNGAAVGGAPGRQAVNAVK